MPKLRDCPNSIPSTINFRFVPVDAVRCGRGCAARCNLTWVMDERGSITPLKSP